MHLLWLKRQEEGKLLAALKDKSPVALPVSAACIQFHMLYI